MPRLQPYANHHGASGVTAWALHGDMLSVEFAGGPVYVYAAADVGASRFAALCDAARSGRGLATLISRDIGARYGARFEDRAHWRRTLAQAASPSKR